MRVAHKAEPLGAQEESRARPLSARDEGANKGSEVDIFVRTAARKRTAAAATAAAAAAATEEAFGERALPLADRCESSSERAGQPPRSRSRGRAPPSEPPS